MLLALLEEQDSYALGFMQELGVKPNDLLQSLRDELSGGGTDDSEIFDFESAAAGAPSQHKGGKSSTKTLDQFGIDLTAKAKKGEIDPVIGRDKEIQRVIQILSRRTKNNPCLIGEPGVGKTAVAEGLALKIASDEVPEPLKDKRIVSLDLTGMIAGTKYRGDFEDRIKNAMDEVKAAGNVILLSTSCTPSSARARRRVRRTPPIY